VRVSIDEDEEVVVHTPDGGARDTKSPHSRVVAAAIVVSGDANPQLWTTVWTRLDRQRKVLQIAYFFGSRDPPEGSL
jgi:hypothetical protein